MNTPKRDFNKEALTWETPARVKLAGDISSAMLVQLQLAQDKDVLDFGCGTGLIAMGLAPHVRTLTGYDTSSGMLAVFQKKTASLLKDNITLIQGDDAAHCNIGGPYHLIISSMTLHHVLDIPKIFAIFQQALHPGGQIVIVDLDEEGGKFHDNNEGIFHFGFKREHITALCTTAGFADVRTMTACQVHKVGSEGQDNVFSLFLLTGQKG